MSDSRMLTMRRALVVSAGLGRVPIASLLGAVGQTAGVKPIVVPNLSSCLGEMARQAFDLLVLSRAAAGDGDALVQVLERCRPDFKGWLLIVGPTSAEIFDCGLAGHPSRNVSLDALPQVAGWAVGDRWPADVGA